MQDHLVQRKPDVCLTKQNQRLKKIIPSISLLTLVLTGGEIASQIANSVIELANSLKNKTNTVHISFIITRNDSLNNKVNEVIMEL